MSVTIHLSSSSSTGFYYPLAGFSLLILEISRSHNDTTQSVGLLWTSDQPVAETSTWQTHNTHNRQTSMPLAGFWHTIPGGEWLQTYALDLTATTIHLSAQRYIPEDWTLLCHSKTLKSCTFPHIHLSAKHYIPEDWTLLCHSKTLKSCTFPSATSSSMKQP
jgi:hypothetical protein